MVEPPPAASPGAGLGYAVVRLAWVTTCLAVLSGCVSLPQSPAALSPQTRDAWDARQLRLGEMEHWAMRGRVSIRHEGESWTGGLTWRQDGETFALRWYGPLGQTLASLEGDANRAVLRISDHEPRVADNPSVLLREYFGWEMPLSRLSHWIRGLPDPRVPGRPSIDHEGRLASLEQAGWRLSLPDYVSVPSSGLELPRKIIAAGDGTTLRLVVDAWSVDLTDPDTALRRQCGGRDCPSSG